MALSDDEFEALVQQLQQNSFADARDAYGEKGFNRWRNPRFHEPIAEPDGSSFLQGSCGDSMGISLKFSDNRVERAAYQTNGCASSALCGSFTAELAIGRTPAELLKLTASDVLEAIGHFPREDRHCATLAVKALQHAVKEYQCNRSRQSHETDQPPQAEQ
jgi:nitrogen fixation protein NifU and related proteins